MMILYREDDFGVVGLDNGLDIRRIVSKQREIIREAIDVYNFKYSIMNRNMSALGKLQDKINDIISEVDNWYINQPKESRDDPLMKILYQKYNSDHFIESAPRIDKIKNEASNMLRDLKGQKNLVEDQDVLIKNEQNKLLNIIVDESKRRNILSLFICEDFIASNDEKVGMLVSDLGIGYNYLSSRHTNWKYNYDVNLRFQIVGENHYD